MFSVAPNIVLVPYMTQNTEHKHRTQDTNTAPIRPPNITETPHMWPGAQGLLSHHTSSHLRSVNLTHRELPSPIPSAY